jgi:ABC-type spermidine/putrescine transport system permease subunit I
MRLLSISFMTRLDSGQRIGPTLDQYVQFFQSPFYLSVMAETFKISGSATLLALLLGYPVAYLLSRLELGTVNRLMILVLLPFWTSILVRTYAWMVLLQRTGVVNSLLWRGGVIEDPLPLMFNEFGVLVGTTHALLPFMILPVYSVLRGLDADFIKAAQGLGATPFRAFLTITLPLSLPGIGAGVLIVFIMALGFFVTPALLGGGKVMMMAMAIERQVNNFLNWEFAAVLAVVLLALTVACVAIFERVLGLERTWGGSA